MPLFKIIFPCPKSPRACLGWKTWWRRFRYRDDAVDAFIFYYFIFSCDIFLVVLVLAFLIFVTHNVFPEFDLDVDDNDNGVSILFVNHFQNLLSWDSLTVWLKKNHRWRTASPSMVRTVWQISHHKDSASTSWRGQTQNGEDLMDVEYIQSCPVQ